MTGSSPAGPAPDDYENEETTVPDTPAAGAYPLLRLQDEFATLVQETVAEGRTVFLSSHELDEVQRLVDRLAIIRDGRIVVTDTVEGLRRSARRTVSFTFRHGVDATRFTALDGVRLVSAADGRVTLSLSGALAPVLRAAADLDAVEMTARPADLEELFLTYYRTDHPVSEVDAAPAVHRAR